MYLGELISLLVAFMWTFTALFIEYASKKLGHLPVNFLRLVLAFLFTGLLLMLFTGHFLPQAADADTWFWMSMSGLVGFVFGDFCLFYSYVVIGSRFGQLFMTLAPPAAAIAGYFILDEKMGWMGVLGMTVTLAGIAISILSRQKSDKGSRNHYSLKLPLKGVLLGIGAGVGQGVGLVLSKLGMQYYSLSAEGSPQEVIQMIPFAASQMRMVIASISLVIILMLSHQLKDIKPVLYNKKAAWSILLATFFGPFLGVAGSLMAVQYTASGIASTIMATTPILILIPAVFIQKQKVRTAEVLGAIISVAGVALFFV